MSSLTLLCWSCDKKIRRGSLIAESGYCPYCGNKVKR